MEQLYGQVILNIVHEKIDRPFTYLIPEQLINEVKEGSCVIIPFGNGNIEKIGYVINITNQCNYDLSKLKSIISIAPKQMSLDDKMITLAFWMKQQYGSTLIQALKTVLPTKQSMNHKVKKTIFRKISIEETKELAKQCKEKNRPAQAILLDLLIQQESISYDKVTKEYKIALSTIRSLEKKEIIGISEENFYRNPYEQTKAKINEPQKILSDEQSKIIHEIKENWHNGIEKKYYIHGITGSGKTQVYIELIQEVVTRGKQAIVLIPEIALTYQTLMRFYACFGERVSIINSTQSMGQKYDQCERAKKGEIDIIIGPRSALFTPFPHLGLIIIDEEHESSYKSEYAPKYHAREVAEKIVQIEQATLVLGSATPSLEAYYQAKKGEYTLFEMTKRMGGGLLPLVEIADMRKELRQGNRSVLSKVLKESIEDRLQKKEQIILFLNRRGYLGFISCRACGHILKCPHCDISLTEHNNEKMYCHYCGYEEKKVKVCPECASNFLLGFKAGTQQIEESLKNIFENVKILRMDADTTRKKGSYEQILKAFHEKKADILLGTQMIVKGHDFPDVTLVGILAADVSLGMADYRSGERTFQLLTQAAGRAGRGSKPGNVVIQTYQPEHYSIVYASKQDFKGFYEEEIGYRSLLNYPPIQHMMVVQILAKNAKSGMALAEYLANEFVKKELGICVLGPKEGLLEKANDIYRFAFYMKNKNYEVLVQIKDKLEKKIEELELKQESVQFDFNPINTF